MSDHGTGTAWLRDLPPIREIEEEHERDWPEALAVLESYGAHDLIEVLEL